MHECVYVCCEMVGEGGRERGHVTITVTNLVFGFECYFV